MQLHTITAVQPYHRPQAAASVRRVAPAPVQLQTQQPRFEGWHLKPYNKLSLIAGSTFVAASGGMIVESVAAGQPVAISSILWLLGSLTGLGAVLLEQYAKNIEEMNVRRLKRREARLAKNKPPAVHKPGGKETPDTHQSGDGLTESASKGKPTDKTDSDKP